MRAVIIAMGDNPALSSLLHYKPSPLLHVVDKPIIFHILDFLTGCKIAKYDIFLCHHADMIETALGNGDRFGIQLTYHLVRNPLYPYSTLRTVSKGWKDKHLLLASGESLPKISKKTFLALTKHPKPTMWFFPTGVWSGWGIIPTEELSKLSLNATPTDFQSALSKNLMREEFSPLIEINSMKGLKNSNIRALFPSSTLHFPPTAHMADHSVWISRAVSLHPTVTLKPPLFIGENCQIKEHAVIGPYTVIENSCIVDVGSKISNTLVLQHSYIGQKLSLQKAIVDRSLLVNIPLNTEVHIQDDFILSEIPSVSPLNIVYKGLQRLFACIMFIAILPLFLCMLISCRLKKDPKLFLPAGYNLARWRYFQLYSFEKKNQETALPNKSFPFKRIPILINVIRGEVNFVGVMPRSRDEVINLPPDWKHLYLISKLGLITLSDLDNVTDSLDECYAADAYYTVHMGALFDLRLFFKWLKIKFTQLFTSIKGLYGNP